MRHKFLKLAALCLLFLCLCLLGGEKSEGYSWGAYYTMEAFALAGAWLSGAWLNRLMKREE